MIRVISAAIVALALAAAAGLARPLAQSAPTPYKLGMFQQGDRIFVGMVLKDDVVIDLGTHHRRHATDDQGAHRAVEPAHGRPVRVGRCRHRLQSARVRDEGRTAQGAAADHRPQGAAQHRGELPGARDGDEKHDDHLRERRGRGPEGRARHSWLLGAAGGRPAAEPLLLRQGQHRDYRTQRPHHHPARPRPGRLGVRDEHRHRQSRQARLRATRRPTTSSATR